MLLGLSVVSFSYLFYKLRCTGLFMISSCPEYSCSVSLCCLPGLSITWCVCLWFLLLCICLLDKFSSLIIFPPQSLKAGGGEECINVELKHAASVLLLPPNLLSPNFLSLALASSL